MFDFQYLQPATSSEALSLLDEYKDACIIAGGTDVMVEYRNGKRSEKTVIGILIPDLTKITETADCYVIGAAASLAAVSDFFCAAQPPFRMLHHAAESVGVCQTRNLATIGGNLCSGSASADMATALLVYDAVLVIESAGHCRELPIDRFFIENRKTALAPGELLTQIRVPKPLESNRCDAAFFKLGKRHGHNIAVLNAAAYIARDENGITNHIRLAAGTLAPCPIRLYNTEKFLLSHSAPISEISSLEADISALVQNEISPRDSQRASAQYRRAVAPAAIMRVLKAACGLEDMS